MRTGDSGPEVGSLHQRLVEAGSGIPSDELASESYGQGTAAAVRAFQASRGLVVDGIAGPITLQALAEPGDSDYVQRGWFYEPARIRPTVRPVVMAAVGDVGRREEPNGSNDGPMLAKYRTGGAPWCATALSTWYRQADRGSPWGRLSSVWDIRDWCAHMGLILPPESRLEPGDVAMVLRAQRRGHVALVCSVFPDGRLGTCAGNEGNAVRARIRNRSDFTVFARPIP